MQKTNLFLLLFSCQLSISLFGQTGITFDNFKVPFSYFGSYLILSERNYSDTARKNVVYVRAGWDQVLTIEPYMNDVKQSFTTVVTPYKYTISSRFGSYEICFEDVNTLRFRGKGIGLKLTRTQVGNNMNFKIGEGQWRFPKINITTLKGYCESNDLDNNAMNGKNKSSDTTHTWFTMQPDKNGDCEFAVEMCETGLKHRKFIKTFDDCLNDVATSFNQWISKYPPVPEPYKNARDLALYLNWSAVVSPYKNMTRYGMYMSKNWMSAVWSWDNCFNALATAYAYPDLAMDQINLIFDHQHETGAFPDNVNDNNVNYNYAKPPIYGIILQKMMALNAIHEEQLPEIYDHISRLTDYWYNFRDLNNNGIPEYFHGNDSGWDNGTSFDVGFPLESPDLCAYLIIQTDFLSDLAMKLGKNKDAARWKNLSDVLMKRLVSEFWKDGHFTARKSFTGEWNRESQSLIGYIPIILGEKLPAEIRSKLISDIRTSGILTEYGLATENPKSPYYEPEGYWRGPIWAPVTYFIVDGLAKCGEKELSADIAHRFCDMCGKSGFAENFNALTGEGLCDPAYTWTSSVFLLLNYQYLFCLTFSYEDMSIAFPDMSPLKM